jgi:hypothetical protein
MMNFGGVGFDDIGMAIWMVGLHGVCDIGG